MPSYGFTPSPPFEHGSNHRLPIDPGGSAALRCGPPPCAAPRRDDDLVKGQPTRPLGKEEVARIFSGDAQDSRDCARGA